MNSARSIGTYAKWIGIPTALVAATFAGKEAIRSHLNVKKDLETQTAQVVKLQDDSKKVLDAFDALKNAHQSRIVAGQLQIKELRGTNEQETKQLRDALEAAAQELGQVNESLTEAQAKIKIQEVQLDRLTKQDKRVAAAFAPATCAVKGRFGGGTGFFTSVTGKDGKPQTITVSCEHVVSDRILVNSFTGEEKLISNAVKDGKFTVEQYNGNDFAPRKSLLAPVLFKTKQFDIASLKAPEGVPTLPIRNLVRHPIAPGEKVWKIWNGSTYPGTVTPGVITHTKRYFNDYDLVAFETHDVFPGHSGGPLVAEREEDGNHIVEVVGVIYSGTKTNIGWALSGFELKKSLYMQGYKGAMEQDELDEWQRQGMGRLKTYMLPTPSPLSSFAHLLPAIGNKLPYELIGVDTSKIGTVREQPFHRQIEFNSPKLRDKLRNDKAKTK